MKLRVINDELNQTLKPSSLDLKPLLVILAKAQKGAADHLLNDFLSTTF